MIHNSDPRADYLSHKEDIDRAIQEVLKSGHYILGEKVASFEREFAAFCGATYCVAVASGTDALELALRAVGVRSGDVVAVVGLTAIATVSAVVSAGASPVFIDVDEDTLTMSPDHLRKSIEHLHKRGASPRAIVPVHLYGLPAHLNELRDVASECGAAVVEDASQAHGAEYAGQKVGSIGDAAAFSFYPTKNLGAIGDAGAVTTSDRSVALHVRGLRQYGWNEERSSGCHGRNSRMDELQAAILLQKLAHLETENTRRRVNAQRYRELLDPSLTPQIDDSASRHVYHQFVIRTQARQALREHLLAHSIVTGIHYPRAVYMETPYRPFKGLGLTTPVTRGAVDQVLSLPVHPRLGDQDIELVASHVNEWLRDSG